MSQSSSQSTSQGWRKFKNTVSGNSQSQNGKPCANPVIEQWLLEWKEEAVQKNSKMQFVYGRALTSLRKYPLPLGSGKECKMLEFFGDTLCKMIDVRIAKENVCLPSSMASVVSSDMDTGTAESASPKSKKKKKRAKPLNEVASTTTTSSKTKPVLLDLTQSDNEMEINEDEVTSKKVRRNLSNLKFGDAISADKETLCDRSLRQFFITQPKKKERPYIPAFRTGGYAILIAMGKKESTAGYRGYMLKSELLSEAQQYCDSSFTTGGAYTAWNTMALLIKKDLIIKQGNPPKYMLTDAGREKAAQLMRAENGGSGAEEGSQSCDSQTEEETSQGSKFVMQPGEFEIILYVDTGELTAKNKHQEVIGELQKNGINLEVCRLSVGDFAWVCRSKPKENQNRRLTINRSQDLVLPFIVERKRADDLAGSIKDGRFHEQKLRLSQTDMNVIYLIEALDSMKGNCGLGDGALAQAIENTQIVNDFRIQETSSIKDTCSYLTHMTRHLNKMYGSRKLYSCTKEEWPGLKDALDQTYLLRFSDFNEYAVKQRNWTIREMFAKHLLRMRGLSVERAFAIVDRYPSVQDLLRAYSQMETEKEKELMLAPIYYGNMGKTVGPAISKAIYKLYKSPILK